MTYDIELIVDLEDRNLRKLLQLLVKWGFKPKVPLELWILLMKLRDKIG
jgi:hypothetical protein